MTDKPAGRGVFLSLEGIEGVGKSTQATFVGDYLRAAGVDVLSTREPGGTPLAEAIRELVLEPDTEPVPPHCELLLMFASRSAHVNNRIVPALDAGAWVVCDRFTDATLAYQGAGRGMSVDTIRTLASWIHPTTWPDMTLLLDAPVATAMARRKARGAADRFEREESAFFRRVRQGYLDIAAAEPDRVCVIDAAQTVRGVQTDITATLDKLLVSRGREIGGRS